MRVAPPQVKPARVEVVPMPLPPVPAVTAVTVTVLVLDDAVTFAPEQALIAVLRFEAKVVVSELVANVAVDNVRHVFVPSVPLVGAAHEKMLVSFDAPEMVLRLPGVLAVIVVVLPPEPAVTPAVVGQRVIAAARFEANVVGLELVA